MDLPAIEITAAKSTKSARVVWYLVTEEWLCALVSANSSAATPELTCTPTGVNAKNPRLLPDVIYQQVATWINFLLFCTCQRGIRLAGGFIQGLLRGGCAVGDCREGVGDVVTNGVPGGNVRLGTPVL